MRGHLEIAQEVDQPSSPNTQPPSCHHGRRSLIHSINKFTEPVRSVLGIGALNKPLVKNPSSCFKFCYF